MGFSGPVIFRLVLSESVILSTLGGITGLLIATALLKTGNFAIGSEGVLVPFLANTHLILTGVAVSLITGVLAGISPAWTAARAEIVTGLRG